MSVAQVDKSAGAPVKRTVLFLWPYVEWGGVQIYFTAAMKLLKHRDDVRAVMPEGSDRKIIGYLADLGIPCEFFHGRMDLSPARTVWHKVRRRVRDARCAVAIARHLRRYDPGSTVLQADLAPWTAVWFCLLLYLSMKGNVFVTMHSSIPAAPFARRVKLRALFFILCMTRGFHLLASNRDMLESLKPFVPPRVWAAVPVAYTGVDTAEIERAMAPGVNRGNVRRKYGLPEDRLLVLSLGRLAELKGCLVMLDAVKRIQAMDLPLHFVWIGQGPLKDRLEEALREPGMGRIMRILAPAQVGPERKDILGLLNAADIFVHPSFSEGLPGAVLEAMALGKACVATRVNAIPEAVTDRVTGLLVPPGNAKALAEAVAELCRDPSLRERLGAAARQDVLTRFDERIGAQTTVSLYETCRQGAV